MTKDGWSIVYDKAIRDDGSLFWAERLNQSFLDEQRRVLGSYIFYNQYLNEIIPEGEQEFKKEWLKYYLKVPDNHYTFAFIDPAISLSDKADYTALTVVHVDEKNDWYLEVAKRARLTATQTVNLCFQVKEMFSPQIIGIEDVAYQRALLHFLDAEMRKRNQILPIQGVKRGYVKTHNTNARGIMTKEMRIRGLIPRFEWNRIYIKQGLDHFEDEYLKFPKATNDDILDSLSSIEEIAYPPQPIKEPKRAPHPTSPEYEKEYIKNLARRANGDLGNGY